MPIIVKRPAVINDIADIWGYIAKDNEQRADSFVDSLDERLIEIANNPNIGKKRHELFEGLFSFPIGKYLIFYCIISNGIDVIRILHSARDIPTHLKSLEE